MGRAQVLTSLFVTVNFHWDSQRLSQLELVREPRHASRLFTHIFNGHAHMAQVLNTFESFPTKVDICVFSDDRTGLGNVLKSWQLPHVELCGHPDGDDTDPFAVVWEHRHAVEIALQSGARALPCVFAYTHENKGRTQQNAGFCRHVYSFCQCRG